MDIEEIGAEDESDDLVEYFTSLKPQSVSVCEL
jgi:hypothetical protein